MMVARAALLLKRDRAYLVQCAKDDTVRIALSVHVYQDELRWYDTAKVRGVKGRLKSRNASGLVWETDTGVTYRFSELTLETYNTHVKPNVLLSPTFRNTEDIHSYYLQRYGSDAGLPPPAPSVQGRALNPMALGARSLAKKTARKKR
jgi:hypothetical protein